MEQRVRENIVGVDVAKDTLEVFELHSEEVYSIANEGEAIEQWLARWKVPIRLAIEPTNRYHQAVAEAADARGHQVCMVDPYRWPITGKVWVNGSGQTVKTRNCWPGVCLAKTVSCGCGRL